MPAAFLLEEYNMELKELVANILKIFQIQSVKNLPDAIMEQYVDDSLGITQQNIFTEYLNLCPDLTIDYMQSIHQFYNADREEKKQDFTPKSLAKLLAQLVSNKNEKWCCDYCAGSGALTIQKWAENHNIKFWCEELDENVIPLLLFNLSVRNIEAYVLHKNILSGEIFTAYELQKGERYSKIKIINSTELPKIKFDSIISNPPYNIPWNVVDDDRFKIMETIPSANNANFAFVYNALYNLAENGNAAFILPNGVLTSSGNEGNVRKALVKNQKIKAVIALPAHMFESTSIPVCILLFSQKASKITIIDARESYQTEERKQCGELHTKNRVYIKKINFLSDDIINLIHDCINSKKSIDEFCISIDTETVKNNEYIINVGRYIKKATKVETHRPFADIINDINRIIAEKNIVKLSINETIAKQIGIIDIYELEKQNNKMISEQNPFYEKLCNITFLKSDFLTLTKNKNEIKFENRSKESLSSILRMTLPVWKHHIFYLNEQENILLCELRDALLPELMEGKIDLDGLEL